MQRSREAIDEVRRANDILDVVQEFSQVKLKKRGANWIGLCPFHSEKTPSFNVNPDRGYFKCFGCDKSGDIFEFVMSIRGITFGEALRLLAKRANIRLPDRNDAKSQERRQKLEPLHNALRFAAAFFEAQLRRSTKAQDFLNSREFSADTIGRFKLGYAPDGWRGLIEAAAKQHIKPDTLIEAGLIKKHEKGHHYDLFRDRVMFPISSAGNRIVGFGGRRLTADKNTPKYINSPETDVYHKSVVLYGLDKSRRAIRETGEATLVEGYTDVLALHQAGVENVVAGCGTALTQTQVKILGRYTKTLVLIFDADQAGIAAAQRALDLVLGNGLIPYVVSLPNGADPDSYVRDHGADRFRQIISDRKVDFVRFLYNLARISGQTRSPEGKALTISNVLGKVSRIKDPVLANEYLNRVSEQFNIGVNQLHRWRKKPPKTQSIPVRDTTRTPDLQLLEIMLERGAYIIKFVLQHMDENEFSEGAPRQLAESLFELYRQKGQNLPKPIPARMLESEPELHDLAAELSFPRHKLSNYWAKQNIEVRERNKHPMEIAKDNIRAIKRHFINDQMLGLQRKVQTLTPGSPEALDCFESHIAWRKLLDEVNSEDYFES